ncbi:MAG: glutamyl-tRNA reductase [Desulfobacterales bacterium]|nr:MAG: glutamyl-tRNA reductase [Desulfobacterales bacterium]
MQSEKIVLLGVNHKKTPVEVREKLAFAEDYPRHLDALRQVPGVREHYLLSTCNRVELVVVCDDAGTVETDLIHFLFGGKIPLEKARDYLYIFEGTEAVRHLFTVACSLDSLVVGEAQILGQLKEAYRQASTARATGTLLNKLLHKSFAVAKRVRTETGIGASAVSISYAAVELAKKIFGTLENKKVLLVGAGEMAELAAEHLVGNGVSSVAVANRTFVRAMRLADRFGGEALSMDELPQRLEESDIIISSTGSQELILGKKDVQAVMKSRRNRPLFLIDIAVPRDLDPAVNELDNVYLYDIDDLSSVVEVNRQEREREAVKASRIVDEETLKFEHYIETLAVKPTILELREGIHKMAEAELAKTRHRLKDLDESEEQALEAMLHAVTAKILHHPMEYLKSPSCTGRKNISRRVNTVREIFGLPEGRGVTKEHGDD